MIRQQFPQFATQGFTLIDLEERLLPFREARREMADGGAESWERAMLRLLAGERQVIAAESELREACSRALALPSPTLAIVRSWSNCVLTLVTHDGQRTSDSDFKPTVLPHSSSGCRFCGGRLPDGRRATFCPHCGLDLTKRQCQACSTELDAGWHFCVTCGRSAGVADEPLRITRVAS